jgi:hypothetical protein
MLRSRKLQGVLALGVTFAAVSGVAVAQSAPASADPTVTYVAVGSDTVQDVYNAFATAFGGNLLGSYNATNPVTGAISEEITPADGTAGVNCSFDRPNGSGAGVAALKYSLGDHAVTGLQGTHNPQAGCVDIARSSSGPGAGYSGTDAVQYVPFAIDGVTGATGPAAGDPSIGTTFTADHGNGTSSTETIVQTQLNLTEVNQFTLANLQDLYGPKGWTTVSLSGGGTADYKALGETDTTTPAPADSKTIDLYIPQLNSGTEKFWVGTVLGLSAPQAWDSPTIDGAGSPADLQGVPVEEHDGTVYATDPLGYGPFSIAQWIAQRNGHSDRRHGATLANANLQDPFAGSGVPATGTLSTNLGVYNRKVYTVVAQSRVLAGGDLNGLLASSINGVSTGHTAQLCAQTPLIVAYGFARYPNCGEVLTPANAAKI